MRTHLPPLPVFAALLALAAATGCHDPVEDFQQYLVQGYTAEDLLPADRAVGSWRLAGKPQSIGGKRFAESLGQEAADRARRWGPGDSAAAVYNLGTTGRTVTVEVYEMGGGYGAFDVYSFMREKALSPQPPLLEGAKAPADTNGVRVTKVGAQGLLYPFYPEDALPDFRVKPPPNTIIVAPSGRMVRAPPQRLLVFWVERFLVKVLESGGDADSSEAALLAFGNAVTAKVKKPGELAETYVLQISGEEPNSETYSPEGLLGRKELPSGVTARWKGRTGGGLLFIYVAASASEAERRFDKLRAAAGGSLAADYADGLFVGSLPKLGPVVCFRRARAVAGLAGAAEAEERMAAVEEIRKRCAGEPPEAGREPEP